MMFIAVDLPEPDGPMMATNSPRLDREIDAGERMHRGIAAAIGLRRPCRRRSAAAHHESSSRACRDEVIAGLALAARLSTISTCSRRRWRRSSPVTAAGTPSFST